MDILTSFSSAELLYANWLIQSAEGRNWSTLRNHLSQVEIH